MRLPDRLDVRSPANGFARTPGNSARKTSSISLTCTNAGYGTFGFDTTHAATSALAVSVKTILDRRRVVRTQLWARPIIVEPSC
jgi:hypothetical protein